MTVRSSSRNNQLGCRSAWRSVPAAGCARPGLFSKGRTYATTDDIRAVARPVLRHRVITNFNAESSGITSDDVINRLLNELPERSDGDQMAPELAKGVWLGDRRGQYRAWAWISARGTYHKS